MQQEWKHADASEKRSTIYFIRFVVISLYQGFFFSSPVEICVLLRFRRLRK